VLLQSLARSALCPLLKQHLHCMIDARPGVAFDQQLSQAFEVDLSYASVSVGCAQKQKQQQIHI